MPASWIPYSLLVAACAVAFGTWQRLSVVSEVAGKVPALERQVEELVRERDAAVEGLHVQSLRIQEMAISAAQADQAAGRRAGEVMTESRRRVAQDRLVGTTPLEMNKWLEAAFQ